MPKPVDVIYVHHDAGPLLSDPVTTIRGIQRVHQDVQGWRDIAYQEWVAHDGDVFEGRGFGVTDGATAGQSGKSLSICLQGNFENVIPPAVQITSVVNRIVAAAQEGRLSANFRILAHQQAPPYYKDGTNLNATQCCGKFLLERLPEIRRRVIASLDPTPPPTPPTPDPQENDAMYIRYDLDPAATRGQPAVWLVHASGRFAPPKDLLGAIEASGAICHTVTCNAAATIAFFDSHPG